MILWSDDNISISMIFNNLTGQNFKADEYKAYIRNIAFGKMGFVPGTIEPVSYTHLTLPTKA